MSLVLLPADRMQWRLGYRVPAMITKADGAGVSDRLYERQEFLWKAEKTLLQRKHFDAMQFIDHLFQIGEPLLKLLNFF